MEKVTIEINMGNSAFEPDKGQETARVLRELANKLEQGDQPETVKDINGNSVGSVIYE